MSEQTNTYVTKLRSKYGRASVLLNMGTSGGAPGKAGGPVYRLSRTQALTLAQQLLDAFGHHHAPPGVTSVEHIEHIEISAFGNLDE